jgi:hypothetical protein
LANFQSNKIARHFHKEATEKRLISKGWGVGVIRNITISNQFFDLNEQAKHSKNLVAGSSALLSYFSSTM